jgi:hypothetical protein
MTQATEREIQSARAWLGKHGIWVSMPTRLLALRIGARYRPERLELAGLVFGGVFLASAFGFMLVAALLKGKLTASGPIYTASIASACTAWFTARRRERAIFDRLGAAPAASPRRPLAFAGPWFLGTAAVTFLGGAGLCVAMLATSAPYALSWLSLLVISAVAFGTIVTGVLRAPVIAEDEASRFVDDVWRRQDLYTATPLLFGPPVLVDLFEDRLPRGFTVPAIAYVVVVFVLQVIDLLANRRAHRGFPPGNYGTPYSPPGIAQPEPDRMAR